MKKLSAFTLILSFCISSIFAGCQMRDAAPSEIIIWEQMEPAAQAALHEAANDFMSQNPDIIITIEHIDVTELRGKILSQAENDEGPDLIYGPSSNIEFFSSYEIIAPISDYVSQDFLSDFEENALDDGKLGGVQYAIPAINGNHISVVYNKDIIDKAPDTWDELLDISQSFRANTDDDEAAQYGFLYNEIEPFWFVGIFNAFGGEVLDENNNPTLNSEAMVKALQFSKDITQKYNVGFKGMSYDAVESKFANSKTAIILNGDWSWAIYEAQGVNVGVAPGPELPGGGRMTFFASTSGYSISSFVDEDDKEAVGKFLEFIFTPENNAAFAATNTKAPTVKGAAEQDIIKNDELMSSLAETVKYTKPLPLAEEMRAVWNAIRMELPLVLYEDKDPSQAAHDMQKAAEDEVSQIRGTK